MHVVDVSELEAGERSRSVSLEGEETRATPEMLTEWPEGER